MRHSFVKEYKCLFPVMGQINLVFLWVWIFFPSLFSIHNIRYSLTSLILWGWHVSATHLSVTYFTHYQICSWWGFFSPSLVCFYDTGMSNWYLVTSLPISIDFLESLKTLMMTSFTVQPCLRIHASVLCLCAVQQREGHPLCARGHCLRRGPGPERRLPGESGHPSAKCKSKAHLPLSLSPSLRPTLPLSLSLCLFLFLWG